MGGDCCIADFNSKTDHGNNFSIFSSDYKNIFSYAFCIAPLERRAKEDIFKIGYCVHKIIKDRILYFVRELKELNGNVYGGIRIDININELSNNINSLTYNIANSTLNKVLKRLNPSDKILSLIMDTEDRDKRQKKLEDFYQEILSEAKRDLVEKILNLANNYLDVIEDAVYEPLDEFERNLWVIDKENNDFLKYFINLKYKIALCDALLDQVAEAKKLLPERF